MEIKLDDSSSAPTGMQLGRASGFFLPVYHNLVKFFFQNLCISYIFEIYGAFMFVIALYFD